jgi:hypothetical protein
MFAKLKTVKKRVLTVAMEAIQDYKGFKFTIIENIESSKK